MQLTKFCPHKVFGQFHSMKINPQDILYFLKKKKKQRKGYYTPFAENSLF